jgi:hypothetical protein
MPYGGLVSGLEAQSENTKLLDELYGKLGQPSTVEARRRIRRVSREDNRYSRRHKDKPYRRES